MAKQSLKSLAFLCDVWLPVVSVNQFASVATLQKLSALQPSTVDAAEKMRAAQQVADSTTKLLVADRNTTEHRPKMQLGFYAFHYIYGRRGFEMGRSPMFSSYVFLATRNASINLCRDELNECAHVVALQKPQKPMENARASPDDVLQQLFGHHILIENGMTPECDDQVNFDRVCVIIGKLCRIHQESYEHKRWCSWAFASQRCQFSGTLLLLFWSGMETGNNPFAVLDTAGQANFEKSWDKALCDEQVHTLWKFTRTLMQPFRDLCVELKLMAVHDHVLKMNTNFLERTLSQLAADVLCSTQLHQPPDIAGVYNEVLQIGIRRSTLDNEVLKEQVNGFLSCCHELQEYALYLRSFPCRAAAFCSAEATQETRNEILKAAHEEYEMIREIEATAAGSSVLKQHSLHTTFQVYREILATMAMHQFNDCKAIEDIVQAWYPKWGQSSCLEQVFRELEQATKRVGHVENSMPNLTCVAVRALGRRVCGGEDTPATPSLSEKDWEGQVVRNLKEWHEPYRFDEQYVGGWMLPGGVEIFCYTIHVCPASLESKCGGILFRRGPRAYSLLVFLFVSQSIMSITSAALSDILTAYEIRMPKNSSKHAKIRKLMTLDDVKTTLGEDGLEGLEQKMLEIEKGRASKKKEKEPEAEEHADDDDPAVAACCQLLEELDAEEEMEEAKEEEKKDATEARHCSVR
ncbi:unnamed protein product [Symbiodinium sp. CCMP2456]|nr:unnamed protein product [Symbiodinium sp. CCMP2456]